MTVTVLPPRGRVQVPADLPGTDDAGVLTLWALLVWKCGPRPHVTVSHSELATVAGVRRQTVAAWERRAVAAGVLAVRRGQHQSTYRPLRRPRAQDGRRYVELSPQVYAALARHAIGPADVRTLLRFLREFRRTKADHTTRTLAELATAWRTKRDDLAASRRRLAAAGLLEAVQVRCRAVTGLPGSAPEIAQWAAGAAAPAAPASTRPRNRTVHAQEYEPQASTGIYPRDGEPAGQDAFPAAHTPMYPVLTPKTSVVTSQPEAAVRTARVGTPGKPGGPRQRPPQPPARPVRYADPAAVAAVVRAVAVAFPGLPEHGLGRIARDVDAELARGLRTGDQLAARVTRRLAPWSGAAGDPVALARLAVRHGPCPDVLCEDGQRLHTGGPCEHTDPAGRHPAWLAAGPARPAVPPWCGRCDAYDRTYETAAGLLRCPDCHPRHHRKAA